MLLEAMYHVPRDKWAYAYDTETIHLRVRTKRDDVDYVVALTGDKYDWQHTSYDIIMEKAASDDKFDYWEAAVRPKYKRLSYTFRVSKGMETVYLLDNGIRSECPPAPNHFYEFPYIHGIDLFRVPPWAKDAVFYQIMTERFANGNPLINPEGTQPWGGKPELNNFFGGDLQGVLDHLDDLQELGVNALYFTPLFVSSSNHKYDIVDYRRVDPHFGDNELLKQVVEECHRRGLRVMLDAVFNHCSDQFPPFQDVLAKGEYSVYRDWFHVNSFPAEIVDGIPTYDTFGFYGNMPKFNTANHEVKSYLLEVAEYWIKEIKVDGWRLDVANEVDHHFWRDFRKVVKAANPDAYIVGEVWSDSLTWLLGDQFDSVMNYPFSGTVLEFFNGGMDGITFGHRIGGLLMRYPQQTNEVVFNLLGSHDTPRLLTVLGEDKRKLKLTVVFLFTFMGTPCIYYGDEIGLTGNEDPDCRKCMEWDQGKQDRELYDFYRMMISLRKEHKVLREGRFRILQSCEHDPCIVYERADELIHFTVWMNNSPQPRTLSHPMETSDWLDALTGEAVVPERGMMNVALEPYEYRILFRHIVEEASND
ncbi:MULTISPECIES: alpha-glycosidase [unclassified Paenibacillus]|uniref:alpha-glycosidase n=1 Tax=unclassified Paenibacillus TaxID=185978 RepID=UPI0003E213C2|nr:MULTISPECIES: alpha-glycosidase [unclassified Paenibacillus]ETT48334.1 alpha amylase catalytic subunit [Paenibacillus sp. FSL R7-269]OMF93610.1 alpha-glycosidase [Paenibacillus sp. FSL R7-0337]